MSASRPFFVGIVHGLAGSAAAALLIVPLIDDPRWAALYLLTFGFGTIVGMAIITVAIAFVPSTIADDGDPIDVLVLMDEPAFPGCVLSCRPIGVIEGEQKSKKGKERNDRIIAVEKDAHSFAGVKTIDDMGNKFEKELEEFFVNYHKLTGKEYRVLAMKGPDQARKLVKNGRK